MLRKGELVVGWQWAAGSAVIALIAAVPAAKATSVTETVDPSTVSDAYLNIYDYSPTSTNAEGGYLAGEVTPGGLPNNPASYSGTTLTLAPNTYVTTNGYSGGPSSVAPDGVTVAASTYADTTTISGDTVTFNFTVTSDTLAAGYTAEGFVADFTPSYSSSVQNGDPITGPGNYSITFPNTTAGDNIQYGFVVYGPNASTATEPALGTLVITPTGVPEPACLGIVGLLGGAALSRRRRV